MDEFTETSVTIARSLWDQIRTRNNGDGPGEELSVLYAAVLRVALRIPPHLRLATSGAVVACSPGRRRRHRLMATWLRELVDEMMHRVLWMASMGRGSKEL